MTSWLGKKLESAVNFVSGTSDYIGESTSFKLGRNIFRFLFGLPLGVTRLLVVDAPIHLLITVAKIANTTSFETLWKDFSKHVVDPFYTTLDDAAKKMTSNFITGFMFGPYLETANYFKGKLEKYESENYGSAKGDPNSPENLAATNPEIGQEFTKDELRKADTARSIFRPTSCRRISDIMNARPNPRQ